MALIRTNYTRKIYFLNKEDNDKYFINVLMKNVLIQKKSLEILIAHVVQFIHNELHSNV